MAANADVQEIMRPLHEEIAGLGEGIDRLVAENKRLEEALPQPYRLRALREYILEIRGGDANPLVLEDIERWEKQARAVLEVK